MFSHRSPRRSTTHDKTCFLATLVHGSIAGLAVVLALAGCSNPPPAEKAVPAMVREPDYRRGMLTYRIFCAECHDGANDEAPALDDIEAWDERTFEWESVLRQHAARGFLEMPPNGELSEESVNDALFYIGTQIKALDE